MSLAVEHFQLPTSYFLRPSRPLQANELPLFTSMLQELPTRFSPAHLLSLLPTHTNSHLQSLLFFQLIPNNSQNKTNKLLSPHTPHNTTSHQPPPHSTILSHHPLSP